MSTSFVTIPGACPYCSNGHTNVYHSGICPKVKSVEYWPNGLIKKVEFTAAQYDVDLYAAVKSIAEFKLTPDIPSDADLMERQ